MKRPRDCLQRRAGSALVRHAAVALIMVAPIMTGTLLPLGAAYAAPPSSSGGQSCFLLHAWDGQWKASPDSRSIYVKENGVMFRLDLEQPIPLLQSSFAVLHTRGTSDAVCRPEDMHLVVSDRLGGLQNPIVRKITRLTPEEVASLPQNLRL